MSKKQKKQHIVEDDRTSFDAWFQTKLTSGEVKFWQKEEIRVFFKHCKLSDLELPAKYDQLLKQY